MGREVREAVRATEKPGLVQNVMEDCRLPQKSRCFFEQEPLAKARGELYKRPPEGHCCLKEKEGRGKNSKDGETFG